MYLVLVPNSPQEAWFLNDREKREMRKLDVGEKTPFRQSDIEWNQIWEALTIDLHKTICLFLALFANALNGGAINTYISLILKNFVIINNHRLTNVEANQRSLLYGMIPGAIKAAGCTIITLLCFAGVMKQYRFFYILIFAGLHVAAAFMLTYGAHTKVNGHRGGGANVSLAGTYIYNFSVEVAHGGIISLVASNSQGRTKKIFLNAVTLFGFALGNIIGPKVIWKNADKLSQGWGAGNAALCALSAVSYVALIVLFGSYLIENHLKTKKDAKLPPGADPTKLTDRQNPEFRYHL